MTAPTLPSSNDRRRRRRLRLIPIIGYTFVALGLAYFFAATLPSTTVIFVRHADTDAAMAGPDDDPPLNARGRQRAELLADFLRECRRRRRRQRDLRERQAPHAGNGSAAREAVESSRRDRRPPRHRWLHGPRAARSWRRHRADRLALEHDRAADRRAARQQAPAAVRHPTSSTRSTSSRSRGRWQGEDAAVPLSASRPSPAGLEGSPERRTARTARSAAAPSVLRVTVDDRHVDQADSTPSCRRP